MHLGNVYVPVTLPQKYLLRPVLICLFFVIREQVHSIILQNLNSYLNDGDHSETTHLLILWYWLNYHCEREKSRMVS